MKQMPRFYQSISLAAKAGKLVSGEMMTEKIIRSGRACLVLLAGDASENTKKSFKDHCLYYNVPLIMISSKEVLGSLMGKESRAMAAVTDENLSALILRQYEAFQNAGESEA